MFQDVLHKKETFLDFQNISFKRGQKSQFPKGLTHDFGQKFQDFSSFLF